MDNHIAVLNWRGVIQGWIITESDGTLLATDFLGHKLAIYRNDETFTWDGKKVGSGNLLAAYILDPNMVK